MNSAGRAQAVARRLPAQQRLDAEQAAVVDRELRLVEQRELAALQRAVQAAVGDRRHALGHAPLEEHGRAAAQLLGAVHREVGVVQQLVGRGAVVREQRDADAGAHLVVAAARC